MTRDYDVVIASLPYVETQEPLMAPALLKGIVNKTGLSCYTLDLNIEIIRLILNLPEVNQDQVIRWFSYGDNDKCTVTQQAVDNLADYAALRIREYNPKWICLSLFCNTAKKFNFIVCKKLRKYCPQSKIVIGGNAVFTDKDSPRPYGKILTKAKVIDYYIVGDGEEPLYNLLTGSDQGVNQDEFQVLDDLSKQPYSNYDNYNWSLYETKRLPMYASRGCVRRCTFCDVYKLWKKFKIKTAEDVFAEMLYQIEQTGITDFYFRDSLINGSITEFRKLMKLMADYNQTSKKKITWTSFFIFRPQHQMPEEDWKLTADSGAQLLIVGIESLVDSIRFHMRKKFTNADIDYGLQMAKKYGVGLELLIIVGYVNETEEDFQKALQWLRDHEEYAKMPIKQLTIGGTLTITDLTDLYKEAEGFDITIGDKIYLWENKKINLTYEIREARKAEMLNLAHELGYISTSLEKPVT